MGGHPIPPHWLPSWVHRAVRRRTLLRLGVSLTEQAELPARELDEIMRVDDVYTAEQQRRAEEQDRKAR